MRSLTVILAFAGYMLAFCGDATGARQKDLVRAQKKQTDVVPKEPTTAQDYADLSQIKELVGRIATIDVKAGAITINVDWSRWELDAKAIQAGNGKYVDGKKKELLQLQQQLLRDYDQIMRTKNSVQRQQALMRYFADLQKLKAAASGVPAKLDKMLTVVRSSKDFDLDLALDIKVARTELRDKYTDEGEFIARTPEELKKLKSPEIPNAYIASPGDLMAGQTVTLYLSPVKSKTAGGLDKDGTKSSSEAVEAGYKGPRPQVRMVLIVDETPPPPSPKDLPKKKK